MRLKRLQLKAVGPFTDRTLNFNSNVPGLHIIYGPNEAGKSSSLRALKALLYGFDHQTPDNFLHNYEQLLVGGCLENSDGEELVFWRRKKRLGDLLDEAGTPLPASALTPFLHGLEPEIFASLFGIDHDALVHGGEEILAQKGEVGQALFAAGSGISSLRQVIDQLEQEAAELFKASGQKPEINRAITSFKELKREFKAAILSCKDWQDNYDTLNRAKKDRTRLEEERDSKNRELRRLERLVQAIPELAALSSYRQELRALGEVVVLPKDFAENHRRTAQTIREAELQLEKDSERCKKLEVQRQALIFNQKLLDCAAGVDALHQRLGEYKKGLKDRPEREGMRISLRKEAALLLQQVRPDLTLDALESLGPVLARKKSIQRLGAGHEAISQQLLQAEKQFRAAEQDYQGTMQSLAAMPARQNSSSLLAAVKIAQKEGDIDALLDRKRHETTEGKKACQAELKRIGRWTGDLQQLMELSLPLPETILQFENQDGILAETQRELDKEQKNLVQELSKAQIEIKKITYAGEIPSEKSLNETRKKREQGWQLLRRQWLKQEDITGDLLNYAPDRPLAETYESYVEQADGLADRLRHEADRVASAASLRAQVEIVQTRLEDNDLRRTVLLQKRQKLDAAWNKLWQPVDIAPLSPKEMTGWLAAMDRLRYRTGDLIKKEQEIKNDVQRRQNLRLAVIEELELLNVPEIPQAEALGPILVLAETILERSARQQAAEEKLTEKRETAKNHLKQAKEDLVHAQEAMGRWQDQWRKMISGLGLTNDITVYEAIDLIDVLQNCFDRAEKAADLRKRIDGIDRDALNLEKDVKALLEQVAPDKVNLPLDQAILLLHTLLSQSQKEYNLYDSLSKQLETLQTEVAGTEKTLQSARTQMNDLLRIAKCNKQEELAAVMEKFDDYRRLKEKISDTKTTLAKIGAGTEIEEIIRQAEAIEADQLPGRIEILQRDITERIHPEINGISQAIGELNNKLATMDGSAGAAKIAEEMQEELARMRRLARRYALVKLASKILQLEIERYRETHQDPVLRIGSRYFREMTLGSFGGLRTDVDDKGAPVLIGLRPGDIRVPVEGMSSGTRDQLFLALRLATLEYRLESHEPMPFIVDDVLINFDDQRARATLQALAKLSVRNQVILFTHHRQLIAEVENIDTRDAVVVHNL